MLHSIQHNSYSIIICDSLFDKTEASLILQKEFPHDDSIKEEDIMYSYCTYIAENAESLNLVEGERVFVLGKILDILNIPFSFDSTFYWISIIIIFLFSCFHTEKHNIDWWFVKKPLTSEKGWVPSQCLMDAESYKQYVEAKLNEKIDRLPVFESEYHKLL